MSPGPAYGYFPKLSKTFLVVKPEHRDEAERIFAGTGIKIASDGDNLAHKAGQRHLGAAIGSNAFIERYLDSKVDAWTAQVDRLADIAATHPMLHLLAMSLASGIVGPSSSVPCLQ
eukprot:scpid92067/ scgid6963/ 